MLPIKQAIGLVLAALVMCLGAAPSDDSAAEADFKKLEGVWTSANPDESDVTYTFKGKSVEVKAPARTYKISLKLDPSAKPEKTIDLHIDEGPDDAKGQTCQGIYKFEGDQFIFCFRLGDRRATQYEQIGFEQFLTKLKRKPI